MHSKRVCLPLCLLAWLIGFGLMPAGSLSAQTPSEPMDITITPYTFTNSDNQEVDAEKGTFTVPENRRDGTDQRIELAFVRFKSTHPNPGSPIVYLAGGPGGSGTGTARGSRFELFMALREVADVIAFDQRGTGLSHRLPRCLHQWTYPADQPGDREKLIAAATANAEQCAAYWREQGVDLAAYNTNESADDLEALRQVLGTEKISLWAISYGTHLALATLKRHPESIDRLILAGVEGLDDTIKLPSDQQALLEKINALVQADSVFSKQVPDLLETMATVLDRLDKQPVTIAVTDPETGETAPLTISKFDVQRITSFMLRGPASFASLPQHYLHMLNGDFSSVAPTIAQANRSGGLSAMSAAMDAASGLSAERRALIERTRTETLLGDAINFPFPHVTAGLGVPDLGPDFRTPVRSDVPTLFISGTLDGRTPVSNAVKARKGFPNSTHLIIDGAGHSDPLFLSSPRILEVMLAFLQGEPLEDENISLPPVAFEHWQPIALDSTTLARYAGTYTSLGPEPITVTTFPEGLTISFPEQGTYTFYPTSRTRFAMREADVSVTFVVNASGQVTVMQIDAQGQQFEAPKQ